MPSVCAEHRVVWLCRAEPFTDHPSCDQPVWYGCRACGERVQLARCGSHDESRCAPCAGTYRRTVRRVADSGRERFPGNTLLLLTLTAPGDQAHEVRPGVPCRCTPVGGVDLGRWNGECGRNWNRFCQALRRLLRDQVQYFRAVEVQQRGALHLHVLIRLRVGQQIRVPALRAMAIDHGFGHSLTLDVVRGGGAASYVAKYVSKAVGERASVPWVHRITGEVGGRASYRTWTASRAWGATMAEVRAAQAAWWRDGGSGGASGETGPAAAGGSPGAAAGGVLISERGVTHGASGVPRAGGVNG